MVNLWVDIMSGASSEFVLRCTRCKKEFGVLERIIECPSCKGTLRVEAVELKVNEFKDIILDAEFSMWRYSGVIPFSEDKISLGEGLTPLVRLPVEGREVVFKLEYVAPTGSFKDRGAATTITRARRMGITGVVEDSSGNAGISYSAYASAAGLKLKVYVPRGSLPGKKLIIRSMGGLVVETTDREEASRLAVASRDKSWFYLGHVIDPFFIEGVKTISYEVQEQVSWERITDVIVPVASGTLLLGIWKGLQELLQLGFIDRAPRLHAVQAAGYAPLCELLSKEKHSCGEEKPSELADGLRVRRPPRLREIVDAVSKTGGEAVVVNDEEIKGSLKVLLKLGFLVEPTSAVVYAAFSKLKRTLGRSVLLPLTGSGLKTLGLNGSSPLATRAL